MGGVVSPVVKLFSKTSEQANNAVQEAAGNKPAIKDGVTTATSEQEQEAARARLRRRGGRQLLSDARLNPEGGVQTLGGGSNLG
jgi:hypothetical protein